MFVIGSQLSESGRNERNTKKRNISSPKTLDEQKYRGPVISNPISGWLWVYYILIENIWRDIAINIYVRFLRSWLV